MVKRKPSLALSGEAQSFVRHVRAALMHAAEGEPKMANEPSRMAKTLGEKSREAAEFGHTVISAMKKTHG